MRLNLPHYLIISGSGKKVGKTHLATALLQHFCTMMPVLALKISPHVHDSLGMAKMVGDDHHFRIFQDMEPHAKNSGQFLGAGALRSYFVETDDQHLPDAFSHFLRLCNPDDLPVICESGALGTLVNPGLAVYITCHPEEINDNKRVNRQQADVILMARTFRKEEVLQNILFSENSWKLKG